MNTNRIYSNLLNSIRDNGDSVETRNSKVKTYHLLDNTTFDRFPLVTVRKTQWKKAIEEMAWFMSGDIKCPDNLLNWWKGQLNKYNELENGYSIQFRASSWDNSYDGIYYFDQIEFILNGLRNNPNSRRLLMTVWNPGEMANITEVNDNPNTPTCCHSIVVQFFVRNGELHIKTYQRSADMLLGVPHNWVQSWAMLMYFAHHSNLKVGTMTWMWGDAHIYEEESHISVVNKIGNLAVTAYFAQKDSELYNYFWENTSIDLVYNPAPSDEPVPPFLADDFSIVGEIPQPLVKIKPKLL